MVDLGQQQRFDPTSVGIGVVATRRGRLWYNLALAAFLIGPGLVALAVMGWLKAP